MIEESDGSKLSQVDVGVVWPKYQSVTLLQVAPPALVGIWAQEAMHWYKLGGTLKKDAFKELARNPSYWIMFLFVSIIGTAFIYFYIGTDETNSKTIVLIGAALPSLLRQLTSGVQAHQDQKLGGVKSLRNYFT